MMKPHEIKSKYCPSCSEDFYNNHNPYGIEECWNLKTAKIIWGKIIGIWQSPPYDHIHNVRRPNCWHKKGMVFIKKED